MKKYTEMSRDELLTVKAALEEEYKTLEAKGLSLNMARGKPGLAQLELAMPMLDILNSDSDMNTILGNDTRNYGDLDGIGDSGHDIVLGSAEFHGILAVDEKVDIHDIGKVEGIHTGIDISLLIVGSDLDHAELHHLSACFSRRESAL